MKRINELLPLLEDALQKGTAKDITNAPPGVEQARAYRAERLERSQPRRTNLTYLPDLPVPADLDVLIALNDMKVLMASTYHYARELVGLPRPCRRCTHDVKLHGPESGLGGVKQMCRECPCDDFHLRAAPTKVRPWMDLVHSSAEIVGAAIEPALRTIVSKMEVALDLSLRGKLIMVRCPWCHGINDAMPLGSLTLRVYVPGTASETYVVCTNPACEPSAEDCGAQYHGRPMWPFPELDWLADRLDRELQKIHDERAARDVS